MPIIIETHGNLDANFCDFAHSYSGTQIYLSDFRMIKRV